MLTTTTFERVARTRTLLLDGITPIGAYLALRDVLPGPSMLFESAPGAGQLARHSIVLAGSAGELVAREGAVEVVVGVERRAFDRAQVLAACRQLLAATAPSGLDAVAARHLGAYGIASFEFAACFEETVRPTPALDAVPGLHLVVPQTAIAFDHHTHLVSIVSLAEDAQSEIEQVAAALEQASVRRPSAAQTRLRHQPSPLSFAAMVERAKDAIREGEICQIVLSQGWEGALAGDAFDAYRRLRSITPSPYMFFLDLPEATVFGSSPEMVCRLEGRYARVRPLAGTRHRPEESAAERAAIQALRSDAKERAEHVMLVDLARNDLGKVCSAGSVSVPECFGIERYSHVVHLVSEVTGTLAPQHDAFDLLAATFPAGTVSGAPKIRAMQLIAQLEARRRGYYGGAVIRAGFDGSLDTCIVVRSAVVRRGVVEIRAGAGIVADSVAQREDAECRSKALAAATALSAAGQELDR
jgi:anthranilate synthase component 1